MKIDQAGRASRVTGAARGTGSATADVSGGSGGRMTCSDGAKEAAIHCGRLAQCVTDRRQNGHPHQGRRHGDRGWRLRIRHPFSNMQPLHARLMSHMPMGWPAQAHAHAVGVLSLPFRAR